MDEQLVRQRLREKEIDPACPHCGSLEERFGSYVLTRAARDWKSIVGRGAQTRIVSATCRNCGGMRLFDAETLGV